MPINQDALTGFLQALVRIESFPGEEEAAIQRAAVEMRTLNFDDLSIDQHGNLIGLVQGEVPGPTLLFDAHADTVPIAPTPPWNHDPFGGQIDDGRIYGRGSTDMKGSIAAMIHAAGTVDRARLAGTVVISISVMEEVLEGVALKAVMDAHPPDFVVIGEPSDLDLVHGGRGRAEIHLEATGKPSHSSAPHLGINAVHLMMRAIAEIETLQLASDPLLGDAIIALTDIISDPYPGNSVIPARCLATYDRRLLFGETVESVLAELAALPAMGAVKAAVGHGRYKTYKGTTLATKKFFPAWKIETGHPFVQSALAGLRAAGLTPKFRAWRFCTNAAYSAGVAQVPTIGFGPSPESLAHMVDEYIAIDDLVAAARGYQGIMEAVLSADNQS